MDLTMILKIQISLMDEASGDTWEITHTADTNDILDLHAPEQMLELDRLRVVAQTMCGNVLKDLINDPPVHHRIVQRI